MEEMKTESIAPPVSATETKAEGNCGCGGNCQCSSMGESDQCGSGNNQNSTWTLAGAILLGSLMISASLLTSFSKMNKGGTVPVPTPTAGAEETQPTGPKTATTSLDDDAVLGNKSKAKVAIVEFSDYECPFCKQFHQTTLKELTKEFVDSGKAVYSFRDYPLPFHEPMASQAANLAQCVREAKGDQAFFAFNDAYFGATQANGKGLPAGKQDEILKTLGANTNSVTQCATSEKFKDEIAKDMNDGSAIGVGGTPSFVIGKLDAKGNVTGELVVGAMPLAQFKATVEKYLAQ